jgi:hypothetical protein
MLFIKFKKDVEKASKESKAKIIYEYLERNKDSAFFSKEIAEALKEKGINPPDIMTNLEDWKEKDWFMFANIEQVMEKLLLKEGFLILGLILQNEEKRQLKKLFKKQKKHWLKNQTQTQ